LEFYLDIALSAFINLNSLNSSFQGKSGDKASAVFSIIGLAIVIGVPIATGCLLWLKRKQLKDEHFKARFGELTTDTKPEYFYHVVLFMLRRLLLALIFVCLRNYCVIQIMCLAYQQTAWLIYIGMARPFEDRISKIREIIIETTAILCIDHLFFFTDWVTTVSATVSYNAGWSQCALISVVLLVSLAEIIRDVVINIKKRLYERKLTKMLVKKRLHELHQKQLQEN